MRCGAAAAPVATRKLDRAGWTLVELMLAMAVVGVLVAIALPLYGNYRDRIDRSTAIRDIQLLQLLINDYTSEGQYPATLAEVGNGSRLDPWGHAYVYLDLTSIQNQGAARKDHNLNPINSDFDLYSMGKNGVTQKQLTNKDSLDDIVRARDGAFIGVAADFTR